MPSTCSTASRPPTRLVHLLVRPADGRRRPRRGAGLDWKTSLQELSAGRRPRRAGVQVIEAGPDHAKTFEAQVRIGQRRYGHGTGRNKKEAEQKAAETAYALSRRATATWAPVR